MYETNHFNFFEAHKVDDMNIKHTMPLVDRDGNRREFEIQDAEELLRSSTSWRLPEDSEWVWRRNGIKHKRENAWVASQMKQA